MIRFEFSRNSNTFNLLLQNIRSFNKNFDDLSVYLDNYMKNIDIMAFSETWHTEDLCTTINTYNDYHTVRANKKGGGVSLYISNKYRSSKLVNMSRICTTFEVCAAVVKVNADLEFYVVSLYRPPDSPLALFLAEFSDFLSSNFISTQNLIILGDFNIDLSANNLSGTELLNTFECYMFIPLIDKPTRVCNTSKNILDHVWSNMDIQFTSYILETNFTDHFTVISSFYLNSPSPFIVKKFRDHSDHTVDNFCNMFNSYATSECHRDEFEFDENVEGVISKISRIYIECCPILSKNLSTNRTTKPWLNGKIIKLIQFKHYLYSEYKKNYIPFGIYDGFKKNLTCAIETVKRNFIKNTFICCKSSSKKTWMNINKYIKASNKKCYSITLVEGGVVQTDDKKMLNHSKTTLLQLLPILIMLFLIQ